MNTNQTTISLLLASLMIAASPAIAGFNVVDRNAETPAVEVTAQPEIAPGFAAKATVVTATPKKRPAIPPSPVIEEGTRARLENERLKDEIKHLNMELADTIVALQKATKNCSVDATATPAPAPETPKLAVVRGVSKMVIPFSNMGVDFELPDDVAQSLLETAKTASKIVLRGRTDSSVTTDASMKIAVTRAVNTKRFLIEHGIPRSKIKTFALASGGFIADNTTDEGRARNRRVEIEIYR